MAISAVIEQWQFRAPKLDLEKRFRLDVLIPSILEARRLPESTRVEEGFPAFSDKCADFFKKAVNAYCTQFVQHDLDLEYPDPKNLLKERLRDEIEDALCDRYVPIWVKFVQDTAISKPRELLTAIRKIAKADPPNSPQSERLGSQLASYLEDVLDYEVKYGSGIRDIYAHQRVRRMQSARIQDVTELQHVTERISAAVQNQVVHAMASVVSTDSASQQERGGSGPTSAMPTSAEDTAIDGQAVSARQTPAGINELFQDPTKRFIAHLYAADHNISQLDVRIDHNGHLCAARSRVAAQSRRQDDGHGERETCEC